MAVTFSQYYEFVRGLDLLEMPVDPQALQRRFDKTLARGHSYAGEPNPAKLDNDEGNINLAAACVGRKPACAILPGQLGNDPDSLEDALTQALLQHGMRVRPDLTVKPIQIPGFMRGWSLVGGKSACEELHELLRLQWEMTIQTHPEMASIPDQEKRQHVADIIRGAKRCGYSEKPGPADQCAPLHKRIGELFGYDPGSIDSHVAGLPLKHIPNLPLYTNVPDSMKPHLGPSVPLGYNLGDDGKKEAYDPYLHMLIYEGFIYVSGLSKPRRTG